MTNKTQSNGPLLFTYGENNRTLGTGRYRWNGPHGGMAAARAHARRNGAAGVWHADDSFTLFYMNSGKLRQRKWQHARPVDFAA